MQLCFNAGTTLCHAPQSVMEGCPLPTSCKEGWHAGAGPGTEKGGLSAQFSLPFTTGQNYHLQVTLFGLFVATQRARSPFPGCSILCQSEREGRTQPTGAQREKRRGRGGNQTQAENRVQGWQERSIHPYQLLSLLVFTHIRLLSSRWLTTFPQSPLHLLHPGESMWQTLANGM